VDSENFCNIDEKVEEDMILSSRSFNMPTLSQQIKERYLGPILAQHGGNTGSFLRRNILMTSSNISCSSTSSFKSSFLVKS
jgi:hypothetical protein